MIICISCKYYLKDTDRCSFSMSSSHIAIPSCNGPFPKEKRKTYKLYQLESALKAGKKIRSLGTDGFVYYDKSCRSLRFIPSLDTSEFHSVFLPSFEMIFEEDWEVVEESLAGWGLDNLGPLE